MVRNRRRFRLQTFAETKRRARRETGDYSDCFACSFWFKPTGLSMERRTRNKRSSCLSMASSTLESCATESDVKVPAHRSACRASSSLSRLSVPSFTRVPAVDAKSIMKIHGGILWRKRLTCRWTEARSTGSDFLVRHFPSTLSRSRGCFLWTRLFQRRIMVFFRTFRPRRNFENQSAALL